MKKKDNAVFFLLCFGFLVAGVADAKRGDIYRHKRPTGPKLGIYFQGFFAADKYLQVCFLIFDRDKASLSRS